MGWVSVNDAMPEPWQTVIAWAPNGQSQEPNVMKQCALVGGQFQHGYYQNRLSGVTHWMPMPEAPEDLE